jgi:hypothetical protein
LLQNRADQRSPRHFALRVKDAQAARACFQAKAISVEETTPIPGADRFFIYDPDGNRIEIIQWLERYDPARSGATYLDNGRRQAEGPERY